MSRFGDFIRGVGRKVSSFITGKGRESFSPKPSSGGPRGPTGGGRFTSEIDRFGRKAIDGTLRVKRMASREMYTRVINDTPVLTGWLKNNWHTSIGAPSSEIRQTRDPAGTESFAQMMSTVVTVGHHDTLYFRNNLPYFNRIEYEGYSPKAPGGMLRIHLAEWDMIVEEMKLRVS